MNILLLTSVYKDESLGNKDKSTVVVNQFACKWVELGHAVFVIHNVHRYPILVHAMPNIVRFKLSSFLNFYIPDMSGVSRKHYFEKGVSVWRLPMLKLIPHKQHGYFQIKKQVSRIKKILKNENYYPDIILAHWASPQMELLYELKKVYHCQTSIVLHGTDYIKNKNYPAKKYLENIDKIGCRSKTQAENIKRILSLNTIPFICYSGVPDEFLNLLKLNTQKYININTWKFIYVGRLVSYKNVDLIIEALSTFTKIKWSFDIVGEGPEEANLRRIANSRNCLDKITFHGKKSREAVILLLQQSHCFVMVSKNEVFGLSYLEAMAASCLTIGSLGEGIDGIIKHKENGFLCNPADKIDLIHQINDILKYKTDDLIKIATKAYKTASNYSDSKVAADYLEKAKAEKCI